MSSFKRKMKGSESLSTPVASDGTEPIVPSSAEPAAGASSSTMVSVVPISGMKPWIHTGLGMVSSGHRELDEMLHGGFPCGSMVTYYLDDYSNYSETLMSYSIAESISHGQNCLVFGIEEMQLDQILQILPFNLSYDKIYGKTSSASSSGRSATNEDHGLKIAWQYEKYLAKNINVNNNKLVDTRGLSYCCSYDLSRRLQPEIVDSGSLLLSKMLTPLSSQNPQDILNAQLQHIFTTIKQFLLAEYQVNARGVSRIFLPHIHQLFSSFIVTNQLSLSQIYKAFSQFLFSLRQLIQNARTVVHLSFPNPQQPSTSLFSRDFFTLLHFTCDIILDCESFAGHADTIPPEFKNFAAFFRVLQLRQRGLLATPPPKATKYGLKRDRRKLHIELLHLPPEESRAMSTSNSINATTTTSISNSNMNSSSTSKMASLLGLTHASPTPSTSSHNSSNCQDHGHGQRLGHISLELEPNNNHSNEHITEAPSSSTNKSKPSSLAAALASARAARSAAASGSAFTSASVRKESPHSLDAITNTADHNRQNNNNDNNHNVISNTLVPQEDSLTATMVVRPISIQSATMHRDTNNIKLSSFQKKNPPPPPSTDF